MHMFRFPKLLIAMAFAGAGMGPVQAQDRTAWVGEHIQGLQEKTDLADVVLFNLELKLDELRTLSLVDPAVSAFVSNIDVKANKMIDFSASARATHYQIDPTGTLLVASGRGVGAAEDFVSGIYLGPPRPGLMVETARAKLLAVESHDAADMYLRLVLHYALIKAALDSGMDYRTVINPLRESALDLSHQAEAAEPAVVALIRDELVQLKETTP
jgi:hypothetical protein